MSTILDLVTRTGTPKRPSAVEPIICRVEVITPMFLAGADQHDIAHELLRVPSLRGMLRWWWRVAQATESTADLLADEGRIWGNLPTKDIPHPPRGIVIRSTPVAGPKTQPIRGITGSAEYYLSYALGGTKGATTGNLSESRPGFSPGQNATVELLAHTPAQRVAAEQALELLCGFGGLGSRNRRTWGSLALRTIDGRTIAAPLAPNDVQTHLTTLLSRVPAQARSGGKDLRTNLGRGTRVETAPCAMTHSQLLDTVHAIFKGPEKLHKEAWCFGLPHTKGKRAEKDGPQWVKRRASPILVKATRLGDDRYALSALLTDGAFLDFIGHETDARAFQLQRERLTTFMERIKECDRPMKVGR